MAPFATAAVVALIAAVPGLSVADTPTLPPLTAAQLVAKVAQTTITHFSGTLDLTTDLGIPDLSTLSQAASGGGGNGGGDAFDPTSLLSGTHQAQVWFDGPTKSRADLLESMAEFDVIHNGSDVWTWDSTSKVVTHKTLQAHTAHPGSKPARDTKPADGAGTNPAVETPQQFADHLLANLSTSTIVTVGPTTNVARHDAYQLLLAPRSGASTVDHVAIAIDRDTGFPLQVEVFAKGQTKAALKLAFGKVDFAQPSASEFNFTPPPGSTMGTSAQAKHPLGLKPGRVGFVHNGQRYKLLTQPDTPDTPASPGAPGAAGGTAGTTNSAKPTTVGQDWTTVVIFPAGQIPPQFSEYLKAGTQVTGKFGTGTLLQTSLVNVLVLNDGRILVGAVNASTLEAAATAAP